MRTCTVMQFTNGTNSHYIIMRGRMCGKAFDAHGAKIIGHFDVQGPIGPDAYRTMTAAYATSKAPAVYWQR